MENSQPEKKCLDTVKILRCGQIKDPLFQWHQQTPPTPLFTPLPVSHLLHLHFHSLHRPSTHPPSTLLDCIHLTQEWDQICPHRMGHQGLLILQVQACTSMDLLLVVSLVLAVTPVHAVTTVVQGDATSEVLGVTIDAILILITLVIPGQEG